MKPFAPRLERLESRLAPATFTVNNLADNGGGTLRQALLNADNHPGPDTILFQLPAPPANGENIITLTGSELSSKGNVTISGPGSSKLIVNGNNLTRVFHIDDGDPTTLSPTTISGLSIVNGKTADYGGGIYSRESLTLKNVVISGNTGDSGGGGVFLVGSLATVNVSNCLVTQNTSNGEGGGLSFAELTSVTINKTVVTGNSTPGTGGGVFASINPLGAGIAITGSVVSNNSANSGGGLDVEDQNTAPTSKIVVTGTTIIGNASNGTGDGGGGLLVAQGNTVISGSTIRNNAAVYSGGGISASSFTSLTISKSTITGNQTVATNAPYQGGGGVFIQGSGNPTPQPVKVIGTHFTDNHSRKDGGGLFVHGGIALTISGSTFSGNRALSSGGGVETSGSGADKVDLTVIGGTFSDNVAADFGGGIDAHGSGAIAITAAKVSGNLAGTGGGIYANSDSASVTITNVAFTGNVAAFFGGGLDIEGTLGFKISGGSFKGNSAADGGGVRLFGSTGSILGVTISGNMATDLGGGVFNAGLVPGTLSLQIAKVKANIAPTSPDVFGPFTPI